MKNNQLTCLIVLQFVSMVLFGHADHVPYCQETPFNQLNSVNKDWNKQEDIPTKNNFTKDESAPTAPPHEGYFCYVKEELDMPFTIVNQEIRTILTSFNTVYIGGNFSHYDTESMEIQTSGVYSYETNDWGVGNYTSLGNNIQGTVYDLEFYNGDLYAVGDFVLEGTDFRNIAYYDDDSEQWIGVQTGDMNGTIRAMVSYGCALHIGGDFTMIDGNSMSNLAVWDGVSWSISPPNCSWNIQTPDLQVNGPVNTFEVYEGKLAIGGEFTQVNTNSAEGLFFLNGLTVESLPVHGSMTSVDNLEVYGTALLIGADSLYAYRWDKWYYTHDTIQQDEIMLGGYGSNTADWYIPAIGRTHEIYYAPSSDYYDVPMNQLAISAGNEVFGFNCQGSVYCWWEGYRYSVNGAVYAMGRTRNHLPFYGGDFSIVDMEQSNPSSRDDCDGGFAAEGLFKLYGLILLPIELAKFTVKSDDNKTAKLGWTSLTENNSSHYEIERKTDNEDFVRVGTAAAAGESLEEINYTYEDDISKVSGDYVYYRLKMVDKDGSYEYSDVRSLKLETQDTGIFIAPNPAVDVVELSMKMETSGYVNVHIYDMQGRQLCNYQWKYNDNSIVRERIDVSHLEAGLYLIEVISPHERKTMKLDVLK